MELETLVNRSIIPRTKCGAIVFSVFNFPLIFTFSLVLQVNLAHLLKKPIIPVLIDNTKWPPEGAMSVLFAELAYIRFFNKKEYVRGEQFWDDVNFLELLSQISNNATPDESLISDGMRTDHD